MLRAFASGSLYGQSYGTGPARLLALHGWGHDHRDFDQLLDRTLKGTFSSIAVDLAGFGATPAPEVPWGSGDYARSILPILDEMAPLPVILGHSFGGRVALEIAAQQPGRIGGLVLTGVPLVAPEGGSRPSYSYRAVRALARHGLISEARLERARQRHGSDDYRAAQGVMRDILVRSVNERYEAILPTIDARTELIWGELDGTAPLAQAREAQQLFPHSTLTIVTGVGHMTPIDAVSDLARAVERLLP